jgi:hypothetical protein
MPSSHPKQINEIVSIISHLKPKKFIDIGVGFGKYGFLVREYADVNCRPGNEPYVYENKRTIIHGIEGFPEYIGDLQRNIYDKLFLGDALKKVDEIDNDYDLIFLVDIFEHFSKEDGELLLDKLLKKGKNILISTPKNMQEQDDVFGNEFEIHRYNWHKRDFERHQNKLIIPNSYSLLVFIGEKSKEVANLFSKSYYLKSLFRKKYYDVLILLGKNYPFLRKLNPKNWGS